MGLGELDSYFFLDFLGFASYTKHHLLHWTENVEVVSLIAELNCPMHCHPALAE
jgi:hypothetical protein